MYKGCTYNVIYNNYDYIFVLVFKMITRKPNFHKFGFNNLSLLLLLKYFS